MFLVSQSARKLLIITSPETVQFFPQKWSLFEEQYILLSQGKKIGK